METNQPPKNLSPEQFVRILKLSTYGDDFINTGMALHNSYVQGQHHIRVITKLLAASLEGRENFTVSEIGYKATDDKHLAIDKVGDNYEVKITKMAPEILMPDGHGINGNDQNVQSARKLTLVP
jgi:hypothetical protein